MSLCGTPVILDIFLWGSSRQENWTMISIITGRIVIGMISNAEQDWIKVMADHTTFSAGCERYFTEFSETRRPFFVWALPRLASSGLVWSCLAMSCHALSCLAWVRAWRFFVKYQKWDSYCGVVLMSIFSLLTIWLITIDNNVGKI